MVKGFEAVASWTIGSCEVLVIFFYVEVRGT